MGTTKEDDLFAFADIAAGCERCGLCATRTHSVFGKGSPEADLMIVGEAPGEEEDRTGVPFVGPSGEMLDRMISGMGLAPYQVYVANSQKCRPPGNRRPTMEEIEACRDFLLAQLEIVDPVVVLAMGRTAMLALEMGLKERWRGIWVLKDQRPMLATYHPAYVLRNPAAATVVGKDLRLVSNEVKRRSRYTQA